MRVRPSSTVVLFAALVGIGCGGSSSISSTPPGQGIPSKIVVSAGDQQNGVPGETLPLPVDVVVLDDTGSAVSNVVVTFSISGAGQTLPQSVTTVEGHARALVRLPSQPLTQVTITASCSTISATLTATTGPRLLATFGNATAAHGAVRPDGTYVGLPRLGDAPPGFGYDLFAADGTLAGRLGPLQGKMSIPGLYYDLSSVVSTPDRKLYFRSYLSSVDNSMYIFQLDGELNLTQFTRVTSPGQSFSLAGPMTVDASGNFYIALDPGSVTVLVFDPSGRQINKIVVGGSVLGLAINHSGNLVAFVSDQNRVFSFQEYSMVGSLVNSSSPLPVSSLATFAQDSAGNYLVLDNAVPLYKFDQNYNLLWVINLSDGPGFGSGNAVVSGGDASGNSYISTRSSTGLLKYDQNGNLVSETAWPVQDSCPGCPTPAYINQLISPSAMAVDNATSDLYVADNFASVSMGRAVLRYTNQQFAARLAMPQGEFADDIAISSARELYVADYHYNSVHVLDLGGNELRTIQGPEVGVPMSIAIDSNDNKYILDFSTSSIHVFDSSDRLFATIALNIPPPLQGNLRVGGDGNLLLAEWTGGQSTVMKLATDGTELFSVTYLSSEFFPYWATTDTQGNMFLAGPNQLRILDAKGNKLGEFDYSNGLFSYAPSPCGLARQGDTVYACYFNRINAFSAQ
jgi:sugar lactone lactonase YvrE